MDSDRSVDYADALNGADPTSPQEMPAVSGGGEMDIGTAEIAANLEASSTVYWLQAFLDKHKTYAQEFAPTIARLKQLALQVETGQPDAPMPPPQPPPMPPAAPPQPGAAPGSPIGPPPPRPGGPATAPPVIGPRPV